MKKVLFVNSSLDSGGSERVMSLISNYFAEKNYDVTMALLRDKKKVYEVNNKINLIQFKYNTKNKFMVLLKRFFQYRKLLRQTKPDVIISFMWDINVFTLLSSFGYKKCKIIVSERCHPKMGNQNLIRKIGQKWLYNYADRVVIQTEYVRQFYPKKIQEKSITIPNPINSNIPKPYEGEKDNIICAAGRFTEQKRYDLLINAFYDLNKEINDYRLVIYGDGPLKGEYEKLIKKLNLKNKVELPGYVSNVNEEMNRCKIYVSCSDYEGISNSMLEALAMGIPSICSDCPVGGARMVIKNKNNGILIPTNDSKALSESLIELIRNKNLYNQISREAVKVKDTYEYKKIGEKWEKICNDV